MVVLRVAGDQLTRFTSSPASAESFVRLSWTRRSFPRHPRKRMSSGDGPGLQNRRVAGLLSPVGSTPTRFRQIFPHGYHVFTNRLLVDQGQETPKLAPNARIQTGKVVCA